MKLRLKHPMLAAGILALATSAHAMSCTPISETKQLPNRTFQLSGTLHKRWFWGPPNFGEHPKTDAHYQGWMITLDHPLKLLNWPYEDKGTPNKNLWEIHLRFLRKPIPNMSSLVGKHVVIDGPLELGTGPADQTLIVSWPTSINVSSKQLATECLLNTD